jgi:beta-lactamase superfamily II metal-dependent hydrolase
MIDICDGNIDERVIKADLAESRRTNPRGNFGMCGYPTNPIRYVQLLGIDRIWRFVLTHPDMDHMDGLSALVDTIGIDNFWHPGVDRESPDFEGGPYDEADWDRYVKLRAGNEPEITTLRKLAGARFKLANRNAEGNSGGDALSILSPNEALVAAASADGDLNDGSYVLLYRSAGGRILVPGDAHDATWEYVLTHYASDVANCSVMIAPHHGRHSDRSFEFLDEIKPKLTLFGCAPSEHLAYGAWNSRQLDFITSNQAGNIVLEIDSEHIDVYVENEGFAIAKGVDVSVKNGQGYTGLWRITPTKE